MRYRFQTCTRHPQAGRFLRTCPGCARDQYDREQRNRAEADTMRHALAALTAHGTTGARILTAHRQGTTLTVATHQPTAHHPYAVDTFRLPTDAETDPDQTDPLTPGEWILVDSWGDHGEDDLDRMLAGAHQHLAHLGLVPAPAEPSEEFWDHWEDCLVCIDAHTGTYGTRYCPEGAALLTGHTAPDAA